MTSEHSYTEVPRQSTDPVATLERHDIPEPLILFVCTANICRSPAAEAVARFRYGQQGLRFASAGFLVDGKPMEPNMAKALNAAAGIPPLDHRSRRITPEILDSADLVVTMESRHVQDLVIEDGAAFDKIVPLKEAIHIANRTDANNLISLLNQLQDRDPVSYLDARWDVEDPYKRSRRRYRKSANEIVQLVDALVGRLS